jgi:hypothetical protein
MVPWISGTCPDGNKVSSKTSQVYTAISLLVTLLPLVKYDFAAVYFPDLEPLDYGTWGILPVKVNTRTRPKMGTLKQTIWQVWVVKMRRWYSKTATWSGCMWRRFVMVVGSSQANILMHYLKPSAGL